MRGRAGPPGEGLGRGGGRAARRSHPHTYRAGEERKKTPLRRRDTALHIYSGAAQAHSPSTSPSRAGEEAAAAAAAAARGRAVPAAAAGPAAAAPW